jgi:hypothetical protein
MHNDVVIRRVSAGLSYPDPAHLMPKLSAKMLAQSVELTKEVSRLTTSECWDVYLGLPTKFKDFVLINNANGNGASAHIKTRCAWWMKIDIVKKKDQ